MAKECLSFLKTTGGTQLGLEAALVFILLIACKTSDSVTVTSRIYFYHQQEMGNWLVVTVLAKYLSNTFA